jgi:hypothetical protein
MELHLLTVKKGVFVLDFRQKNNDAVVVLSVVY